MHMELFSHLQLSLGCALAALKYPSRHSHSPQTPVCQCRLGYEARETECVGRLLKYVSFSVTLFHSMSSW